MAKPPLGSGERFEQLEDSLTGRKGVRNPRALAAAIGRRKYGKARFRQLAAKGRKKHSMHHVLASDAQAGYFKGR